MQLLFTPKQKWIFLLLMLGFFSASAQPDFRLPLVKPKKYENKTLGSEKTEDKKFTLPRKVYQGMVTHYNFYYNATKKINAILERAKLSHKDDYTELLPFYNYSTTITSADSTELDSVIFKATAGIVLHDLRNSYIDNMYLLIGQSYFYWQKFDSAYRIFQFINYNFFPKGKDEYFIVVGANNRATGGNLNIATKEDNSFLQRAFTQPPSRNDALIWLARTYAEDSLFAEAYSLVNLLRKDALFPKRLHNKLDEIQAYVFYQNEQWDSCAYFLQKALPVAENKTDLARWEYLLGQLYTKTHQPALASTYFNKAKSHTTDPVLYIHARIYEAQLLRTESSNAVSETLSDLIRLSKKERFDGYEDILYYSAAGMALEQGDTAKAQNLLLKSVSYTTENLSTKNKAFIKLADIYYRQSNYAAASNALDSVNYSDPEISKESAKLQIRKDLLHELVKQINIVKQQDSLKAVAKMPENEMNAYLKALVKKIRKQRGLKEEASYGTAVYNTSNTDANTTLFTTTGTGNSWYFYNAQQKTNGFSEFKAKWGNRPNVDNWRRQTAVERIAGQTQNQNTTNNPTADVADVNNISEDNLTVEGLKSNLPLTDEKILQSNKKIAEALFEQGQIYKNQLEDYEQAANVFEEIWKRFGNYEKEQEVLFELYFCHNKAGHKEKAAFFLNELKKKYPAGEMVNIITNAQNPSAIKKDVKTAAYEKIYNQFISGNFTEALTQKKIADSLFGPSYWTPQLLYIEALYHIKQKNDSAAIVSLTNIEQSFPGTPMAEKASVMKDVVSRRNEIETYLTNTNIVRESDSVYIPFDDGPLVNKTNQQVAKDSSGKITIGKLPQQRDDLKKPQIMVQKTGVEKEDKNQAGPISIGNKPKLDTTSIKPLKDTKIEMVYVYTPNEPYVVMMYFDQVDPVYISESRNAFQRYNSSSHSGENIRISTTDNDIQFSFLDMGPFADVTTSLSYMEELQKNAKQIVPWLPTAKYNFIIISTRNLEMLKTRKNMEEYRQFIRQYVKDKF